MARIRIFISKQLSSWPDQDEGDDHPSRHSYIDHPSLSDLAIPSSLPLQMRRPPSPTHVWDHLERPDHSSQPRRYESRLTLGWNPASDSEARGMYFRRRGHRGDASESLIILGGLRSLPLRSERTILAAHTDIIVNDSGGGGRMVFSVYVQQRLNVNEVTQKP